MSLRRILIVHPEPATLGLLASMLRSLGHTIDEVSDERQAVRKLDRDEADVVLIGVDPADEDAMELLAYARRKHPRVASILLFSVASPERTREALRLGASTVLRCPLPATELRAAVTQALNAQVQAAPKAAPAEPVPTPRPAPMPALRAAEPAMPGPAETSEMIGTDPELRHAVEMAAAIAPNPTPALIVGERGTGKAMLARTIHRKSGRRDHAFVEVDCGSMGEPMMARELFGHAVGVPGDSPVVRPGALALADGGTLYLDDVEELSHDLQRQLVRFLRDGEFEPVGSSRPQHADVRLIFGGRRDLAAAVEGGTFRADLYDRIGVVRLKMPALRRRGGDIDRLAGHFLARAAREYGRAVTGFSAEAIEMLRRHDWPGNARELDEVVRRAAILAKGATITAADLAPGIAPTPAPANRGEKAPPRPHLSTSIRPLKEALEEPEKRIIIQALRALNWNRQETARVLDINRTTLYKKMKKYGLLMDQPAWAN